MAGALNSVPTVFSSVSIGSGQSISGTAYPAGTNVNSWKFQTVTTSVATVVASGVSTQTATVTGFGTGDFCDATSNITALPKDIVMQVYLSAANQLTVAFSNFSAATTAVPATDIIVQLVKITP